MTCSVVCVLRSGGEYVPDHARRLYEGVKKHWPHDRPLRFVALTDIPINTKGIEERRLYQRHKGWWSKMELFDASQDVLGNILYFDLDTLIVGSLEQIAKPRPLTLLRDFCHPERLQSGMMYLPIGSRPLVSAAFIADAEYIMKFIRGDGEFLDSVWRDRNPVVWQDSGTDTEGQVVSYKVHVRQRKGQSIPDHTRVVCFHGQPRPWATPLWNRA